MSASIGDMELVISLWHDGLTANSLVLGLCRNDIEKLACYLKYITGLADKNDAAVQKMIAAGEMYE